MPNILVIDDEIKITKILEKFLTKSGFEVIKISSGKEAIEFLNSEQKADLIIMDMKMPKITGFDVLKEKQRLNDKTPTIILTGSVDAEKYNKELNQFGFILEDIVYKPLNLFMLLNKVEKKLGISPLIIAETDKDVLQGKAG